MGEWRPAVARGSGGGRCLGAVSLGFSTEALRGSAGAFTLPKNRNRFSMNLVHGYQRRCAGHVVDDRKIGLHVFRTVPCAGAHIEASKSRVADPSMPRENKMSELGISREAPKPEKRDLGNRRIEKGALQ